MEWSEEGHFEEGDIDATRMHEGNGSIDKQPQIDLPDDIMQIGQIGKRGWRMSIKRRMLGRNMIGGPVQAARENSRITRSLHIMEKAKLLKMQRNLEVHKKIDPTFLVSLNFSLFDQIQQHLEHNVHHRLLVYPAKQQRDNTHRTKVSSKTHIGLNFDQSQNVGSDIVMWDS